VRLLLATRNAHKLREFERLLPGVELDPLPDGEPSPEETGDTYAENALIRTAPRPARPTAPRSPTTRASRPRRSSGAPASARPHAGEHAGDAENLAKLHREAPAGSSLRYVCVIAHVTPEGAEHVFEGRCTIRSRPPPAGRAVRL
jgi:XTP/dITP diphosphohydrolase